MGRGRKKLLDQVRNVIRLKHYSIRTGQAHGSWEPVRSMVRKSEGIPQGSVGKGLLGFVEVAEDEVGKFLPYHIHHPRYSNRLASLQVHSLKIEVRVDIEVAHLDRIDVGFPDE